MLKPTESPSPSSAPRLQASISPGPPPVITAQPRSAKPRATRPRRNVGRTAFRNARRAEHGHGRPVDLRELGEPRAELGRDPLDLRVSRGVGAEEPAVVHYNRCCGM